MVKTSTHSKGRTPLKKRRVWFLLGGIVALATAFWLLEFRGAQSNIRAERNVSTVSMGTQMPYAVQRRAKITIAVIGEGPLASAMQKALRVEVHNAKIGDVEVVRELERAYPNPVLVVRLGKQSLFWTPFFANSSVGIQAGFASSGETGLLMETPVTVDNKNGPVLILSGEYRFTDCSWGLISRPGYHRFLAEYAARQIVASLQDLYAGP